ncbi:MAG: aspartate-semialdehyde dehydrogenase [Chloroflexota bacterium]
MNKIPVGILGATGMVGQRFVQLLEGHPWFEVSQVLASERSAGQPYGAACHWLLPTPMPAAAQGLPVKAISPDTAAKLDCRLLFSALPGKEARPVEENYAQAGYAVCSNASAHRMDADAPLLIPEVNAAHTRLIDVQRRGRGWPGFIVTNANCSTTALAIVLRPLQDAFGLRRLSVVTMQAISGAGYPGVASLDILGNVIPYIDGEEEKVESEPLKLLGKFDQAAIQPADFRISAQCNRVPVLNGHTECLSLEFEQPADPSTVIEALETFSAGEPVAGLPSTPARPVIVRREPDSPQPARDVETQRGMAVLVGRVRPCPLFDIKLVLLGHNTVRGAAGGAIHNAELLLAQGYLES